MELFFPQVYREMDLRQMKLLQQEIFTDVTRGDKHRVDILVETRLKGEPGIVLVHVENQAQPQAELEAAVRKMPAEELERLAEAIFELENLEEVKSFLE